ncbi:MAG: O-antigen ligase family protein [Armatimonadetes bacterium]|nr:O-antigen ligase family protein [Armatimonadota bacterium]
MSSRRQFVLWIVALIIGLAPVLGGQVVIGASPIDPGLAGILKGMLAAPELPYTMHTLLALPIIAVAVAMSIKHRVWLLPRYPILLPLTLLFALISASCLLSSYRYTSILAAAEWASYGILLLVVVAVSGRSEGPKIILAALAVGGTILALKGVSEYAEMRRIDPNWRIFADWIQQNALAGMLNLCIFAGIGTALVAKRLSTLLAILATGIMLFSMLLTQSKGGYLSFAAGFGVMVILLVPKSTRPSIGMALVPVALAALLIGGLKLSQPAAASGGVLGRVAKAGEQQEQSGGFRKLLWISAGKLAMANPAGTGIDTFRNIGAQPGLVAPTQYAHSTYLQLAAECSILAPLVLLWLLFAWARGMFRAQGEIPTDSLKLRAVVVGAITCCAIHNQIDSLLYSFGIGVGFFALLAVGLLVSADGSSPELVPTPLRTWFVGVIPALVAIVLIHGSRTELLKAQALGLLTRQDPSGVELLESAESWAPLDGSTRYLIARTSLDPKSPEYLSKLEEATRLDPSLRYFRALATTFDLQGKPAEAIEAVDKALQLDPNNLPGHLLKISIAEHLQDPALVKKACEDAIAVEQTTAFQIRAIPEMIPTETFEARIKLAELTTDRPTAIRLLQEAVDGFKRYWTTSVPLVARAAKEDINANYAGENWQDVQRKRIVAQQACKKLAGLLAAGGDQRTADRVLEESAVFDSGVDLGGVK